MLSNATIDNGVATAGTYNNFKGVVRNDNTQGDDKLNSIGWNTKFKAGDWKLAADLAQSKVTRESTRYETTAGLPGDAKNNGTATDTADRVEIGPDGVTADVGDADTRVRADTNAGTLTVED